MRCLALGTTWQDRADNFILPQKSKGEHPLLHVVYYTLWLLDYTVPTLVFHLPPH